MAHFFTGKSDPVTEPQLFDQKGGASLFGANDHKIESCHFRRARWARHTNRQRPRYEGPTIENRLCNAVLASGWWRLRSTQESIKCVRCRLRSRHLSSIIGAPLLSTSGVPRSATSIGFKSSVMASRGVVRAGGANQTITLRPHGPRPTNTISRSARKHTLYTSLSKQYENQLEAGMLRRSNGQSQLRLSRFHPSNPRTASLCPPQNSGR